MNWHDDKFIQTDITFFGNFLVLFLLGKGNNMPV